MVGVGQAELATDVDQILLEQRQDAVVARGEQVVEHVVAVGGQFEQEAAVDVAPVARRVQLAKAPVGAEQVVVAGVEQLRVVVRGHDADQAEPVAGRELDDAPQFQAGGRVADAGHQQRQLRQWQQVLRSQALLAAGHQVDALQQIADEEQRVDEVAQHHQAAPLHHRLGRVDLVRWHPVPFNDHYSSWQHWSSGIRPKIPFRSDWPFF